MQTNNKVSDNRRRNQQERGQNKPRDQNKPREQNKPRDGKFRPASQEEQKLQSQLEQIRKEYTGLCAQKKEAFFGAEKADYDIRRFIGYSEENKTKLKDIIASIEEQKKKQQGINGSNMQDRRAEAERKLADVKKALSEVIPDFVFVTKEGKPKPPGAILDAFDNKVKQLEKAIESGELDAKTEKSYIGTIGKLKAKNTHELAVHFEAANDALRKANQDPKQSYEFAFQEFTIAVLHESLQNVFAQQQKLTEKLNNSVNDRNELLKKSADLEKPIADLVLRQNDLMNQISLNRYQEKQKRIEEYNKREQQMLEKQKMYEDEKTEFEQRKPYSLEIEMCESLIRYLQPFVPHVAKEKTTEEKTKEEKPKEEEKPHTNKTNVKEAQILVEKKVDVQQVKKQQRKKKKKAEPSNIVHNLGVFKQFEVIGVACPLLAEDTQATINEIRERMKAYKKKAADELNGGKKEKEEKAEEKEEKVEQKEVEQKEKEEEKVEEEKTE